MKIKNPLIIITNYLFEINALIFPATQGLNCTGIFENPESSWHDVRQVHGYDSICDAPVIATAVQYANEDQYDTVMKQILNITQGSETMIKQVNFFFLRSKHSKQLCIFL